MTKVKEGKLNKNTDYLSEGWIETSLGEVVEIKYGKDHKKLEEGKIPCYGSGGIMRNVEKFLYDKPSVLIPRKGTISNLFFIEKPFWTVDTLFYTKIDEGKILPKFLFYKLKNEKLEDLNVGSAVPSLTTAVLNDFRINLPPLPQQKAIAKVLSAFDDKIELLREQNETLEKIGQEVFGEWFGKYKIGDELPDGWRVGKLKDIINIFSGFAFKSKDFVENGKYGLVTIRNVQDGSFVQETKDRLNIIPEKMPNYCRLKTGDILLSLTGNVGRVCHVVGENYFLNQRVAKLEGKNKNDFAFTYLFFREKSFLGFLENLSSGTAQQNLSPIKTGEIEIIIPSREKLDEFADLVNQYIEKILLNLEQIQTLVKTRDNLLPKLMKGEILLNNLMK